MAEVETLSLLAMLAIGLAGAGHCVGMCGGIATGLGFVSGAGSDRILVVGYHLGRVLSYAIAGVLVASFGYWGREWLALGPSLRIVAGVILVLMGCQLAGWWNPLNYLERTGALLWRRIQPLGRRLLPVAGPGQALLLGMLWGWLPCGLVYSALAYAATAPTPWQGGLMMAAFCSGSAPAMVVGGLFSARVRRLLQGRHLRSAMALAMIALGAWTLASVALHGGGGSGHQDPGSGEMHHTH